MSKQINKVRKAIEQRKKDREQKIPNMEKPVSFYDIEEKHGYPPEIAGYTFKRKDGKEFLAGFVFKAILAGILFFTVALLMESELDSLAKPKDVASNLLQNEFPFAKVNYWYQEAFGSPLAFSPQSDFTPGIETDGVLPVIGQITESFQVNGQGVKISPGKEVDVFSHQAGVVIFAGRNGETEKTITIQHADGTDSSYGFLSDIEVYNYQYVTANQRIGRFVPETGSDAVYFSLEKDNDYIDPIAVLEVNDAQ